MSVHLSEVSVIMEKCHPFNSSKCTVHNGRKVRGLGGFVATEADAIDGWTFNVRSFLLVGLSTNCLCSHLTHILNSKISRRVQQAVSADSVRQAGMY